MALLTESLFRSLPFPTSFYASTLFMQRNEICDPGFGLFDDPGEDLIVARKRLLDRVLSYLPESPQQIVMYSNGLGELLAAALRRGLYIEGIFPEPEHYTMARLCCPNTPLMSSARWETLALDDHRYGTVLFQESSRYLDPLVVFGKTYRALAEAGTLILLDEFVTEKCDSDYDGRLRLPYLLALAERCGFTLQDQENLSQGAVSTLAYHRAMLDSEEARLPSERRLSRERLLDLRESNRRDRDAYRESKRVYQLLRFVKRSSLRWRVSHVDSRDFPAVSQLFYQVFGHAISPRLWHWKYGAGRGQGSIAWSDGQVVAHYGAITRPIRYFGQPKQACQVADVMVDQTQRGVLTRKGPFFLTAASLPEACSGYGAKHLIGYGFPNARAMAVAVRLGLYASVGRIVEVFWAPQRSRPSFLAQFRRLVNPDRRVLERTIAPLWDAMSHDLKNAIVGVRDAAWLYHRYLSHPHHEYQLWLLTHRITRIPQGVFVLLQDNHRCELLDVIAPLINIPLLVQGARRIAAGWGVDELYCWISSSYADVFEQCGGQRRDPDIAVPTSVWTIAPDPETLRDHWWLMSGDTDFH